MDHQVYLGLAVFFTLFLCMCLFLLLGKKLGARREITEFKKAQHGMSVMEGAVFALMGLLVAFTFYSANNRFDLRRQLIADEINSISTAYLRLDLLPHESQQQLKDSFRQYVRLRIAVYEKLSAIRPAKIEIAAVERQQKVIWQQALAALKGNPTIAPTMLLVPALNQMFDIANDRIIVANFHMPYVIFFLLIALALTSAILAGYDLADSKRHGFLHIFGFILIVTLTIYTIIDFEFPRVGIILISTHDRELINLLEHMQ